MAIRTPEMGLTIWNNGLDPYSSKQLGSNFTAIEFHDHSPGRGRQIGAAGLADGAVTARNLAALSVGTTALIDRSVTETKMADNAISTRTILDNSVTQAKIAHNGSSGFVDSPVNHTSQSLTYASFTPAIKVPNIIVDGGGLVYIDFLATIKAEYPGTYPNQGACNLAWFLNGVQLASTAISGGAFLAAETIFSYPSIGAGSSTFDVVTSAPGGFFCTRSTEGSGGNVPFPATGVVAHETTEISGITAVPGTTVLRGMAAGTYDIELKQKHYMTSSGLTSPSLITAKNVRMNVYSPRYGA